MAERTTDRESRTFDPRFSPEFQPGYDPRVDREAPPAVNREAAARETPPSLITRVARGGSVQSTDVAASGPASGTVDRDGAADDSDVAGVPSELDETLDFDAALPWWRRLNPYLVALGVLGVAILISAFALLQWVYGAAGNPYTQQVDYLLMQFTMFGAPIMVALGIAILASILVVLALRYKR